MKGAAQYIAATLLIVITITIATLFVGWATTLTNTQSQAVGNKTKAGIDCTRAKITIEDVYIDFGSNKTRINVRNSGLFDDSVISAVVLSAAGNASTNLTAFPLVIGKGDQSSIELNTSGRITTCSNFSKAVVTTACASREFDGTPKNC